MPTDNPKDIEATPQSESQNEAALDHLPEALGPSESAGENPFHFFTEWDSEEDAEAFKDL